MTQHPVDQHIPIRDVQQAIIVTVEALLPFPQNHNGLYIHPGRPFVVLTLRAAQCLLSKTFNPT